MQENNSTFDPWILVRKTNLKTTQKKNILKNGKLQR